MTTEILNLNEISMNLNDIILTETINLNQKMAEELMYDNEFPPLVKKVEETSPLFKNDSTFDCKYLAELFNCEHEEMFGGVGVDNMPHTYEVWEMFMKYFLNLEYVKEYDESTYHLHIVKC